MKTIEQFKKDLIIELACDDDTLIRCAVNETIKFTQRWIRVEDEMPKPDTDIIVKFTIVEGCDELALAEYSDDCIWHWRGYDFKEPQRITHWRPIELE